MQGFFDGFGLITRSVSDGTMRLRVGGDGPPLLLLHGNPQTHAMWHEVAPVLARSHIVICPDLRGYGGSFKPAPSSDHGPYAIGLRSLTVSRSNRYARLTAPKARGQKLGGVRPVHGPWPDQ
jgi:pimeloyl-ACP methyl ester carboxylesterase